jgi:hypothetical protein
MRDYTDSLPVDLSALPADQPVLLTIRGGDGDVSYSVFKDFAGRYAYGNIVNYPLGPVATIRGQSLLTVTLVTDTNPFTNRTSLWFLVNNQRFAPFTADAEEDNGTVSYSIALSFI